MYCTKCGTRLENNQNYCTNCGTKTEYKKTYENITYSNKTNNQTENNTGTISLILGILALLLFKNPLFSLPIAIVSIILGKKYKKETGNHTAGPLLSTLGIILSILSIIAIICYTIFATKNIIESIKMEYSNIQEESDTTNEFYNQESPQIPFAINGYSWIGDDNSVLYLNNDNSYIWYQDDAIHNDNYYGGTYNFYTGQNAIDYIASNLDEYSLSKEEQQEIIQNKNYDLNNYYLIILNCTKIKIDGIEQTQDNRKIYYYGFYDNATKQLQLTNMITKNPALFTLKNKIANIDI